MILPLRLALLLCALWMAAPAGAASACDQYWRVKPQLETMPRQLEVTLSFDAGTRTLSTLELPAPWAGVADDADQVTDLRALQPGQTVAPVAGQPRQIRVQHGSGERVVLHYKVNSPLDGDAAVPRSGTDLRRTLLARRWFQTFGHAWVASLATDSAGTSAQRLCVDFEGLPEGSWWIGSHLAQQGSSAHLRLTGDVAMLRDAVYLGGELQVRERMVDGVAVRSVMPPQTDFDFGIDALAARVAHLSEALSRHWHEKPQGPRLVVVQPNHQPSLQSADGSGLVMAHRTLVLHAARDLHVPGEVFDERVLRALLAEWIPDRFGPQGYLGRQDTALRAWFSDGFADYTAHRLLVQAGLWTLDDYARVLSAKINRYLQSPALPLDNLQIAARLPSDPVVAGLPAARGEWLALRWHAALRAKGHPGLEALLRSLLLPAAQAQREGPLSKPLGMHRLLAALRPWLGEPALDDMLTHIDKGVPFEFGPTTLGPCFDMERRAWPAWQLGFDPSTLRSGRVGGVDSQGPAFAAGLRDGMAIVRARFEPGDVLREVGLTLFDATQARFDIRYLPVGSRTVDAPIYRPRSEGLGHPACRAWVGALGHAEDHLLPSKPSQGKTAGGKSGKANKVGKSTAKSKDKAVAKPGKKSKPRTPKRASSR